MSKYTAMMRECEREALTHAASLHPSSEPSKRFANAAADWRAMREAWEAMENVCELVSYGVYSEPDNCLAEAKAALAKARVE